MSDSEKKNGLAAAKAPYGAYQVNIYVQALKTGAKPIVTTDPNKLEDAARQAMSPETFGYVLGGAVEQSTMHANRHALRQWRMIPRMLRPTQPRDLSVKLFGQTYGKYKPHLTSESGLTKRADSPVLMAPVGVQGAYHKDGEKGVARACASLGVPYIYSTAASTTIEDVAAAADDVVAPITNAASPDGVSSDGHNSNGLNSSIAKAPRWFQLYWPKDDAITASLLQRARSTGCNVLVVTLDTFTMAWRPLDLDAGYLPFAKVCQNRANPPLSLSHN